MSSRACRPLKVNALHSPETSASDYPVTERHVQEERKPYSIVKTLILLVSDKEIGGLGRFTLRRAVNAIYSGDERTVCFGYVLAWDSNVFKMHQISKCICVCPIKWFFICIYKHTYTQWGMLERT
jgi:hypothetical protein